MSSKTSNLGFYIERNTGNKYQVVVETISVKDETDSKSVSSAFEIELYRTECGMTLYYPEQDGSIYCAELGELLYPVPQGA